MHVMLGKQGALTVCAARGSVRGAAVAAVAGTGNFLTRFHVIAHVNDAVNAVRRAEIQLGGVGGEERAYRVQEELEELGTGNSPPLQQFPTTPTGLGTGLGTGNFPRVDRQSGHHSGSRGRHGDRKRESGNRKRGQGTGNGDRQQGQRGQAISHPHQQIPRLLLLRIRPPSPI
jgi:hypothetical protein